MFVYRIFLNDSTLWVYRNESLVGSCTDSCGKRGVDYIVITTEANPALLHNITIFSGPIEPAPVPPPPGIFNVTAQDLYDNEALKNFSLTFTNSTTSFHNTTNNGNIVYTNLNGIYDVNVSSNQSGGYFERLFIDVNASSGTFLALLFQSRVTIRALDGFDNSTINSFTASINGTTPRSTSNGSVEFLVKKGTYQLNITSGSFDKKVTNFSIAALANDTINVTLGSIFRFNLIRESTGAIFDWNSTNKTEINVFCPNQSITLRINNTDKANANISKLINCRFTLMQIVVDYGSLGSYFRTLIPSFSQKNITFYLIDVTKGDVAVQKVLKLLDLTGEFGGAILRVKSTVNGILRTIIEQRFDISDEVNLFLVKDRLYTINIENADQDIGLGNLIPTEAGEQSITLPRLDFATDEAVLGGNITFGYTFNTTSGILRVQYNDSTQKTTLVRFTITNESESVLFLGESNNNATVTLTFNGVVGNKTYLTELFVQHPDLTSIDSNIDGFLDKKVFYETSGTVGGFNLAGWTPSEQVDLKKWAAWIFIFFWAFLFSTRHIGIGMTSMVIWIWIFRVWKWIDINNLIFGFVVLIAVVGWIVESMRKQ